MAARTGVTLRRLVPAVYAPILFGTLGSSMLIPVMPLYLTDAGLSLESASVVLAGVGIGASIAGLPVGSLIAKRGEYTALLVAFGVMALVGLPLGFTDSVGLLVGLRVLFGGAHVALRLSRQTYVTRRVPVDQRGRAMSYIGGSYRVALLLGPVVGGVVLDRFGYKATFIVAALTAGLGLAQALVSRDVGLPLLDQSSTRRLVGGMVVGLRTHWRRLLIAGWVPLHVAAARRGRYVVLPLIADELGVSPAGIGAIVTVSTMADLALFPVAGYVMDRFGRLWALIPSFTLMSVGLVWLGTAASTSAVVAAGAMMGVGNGLSSGGLMTYGSDLSPDDAPGPFLAGLAIFEDVGAIAGPLVVGLVGAQLGLGAASVALAILMAIGGAWLLGAIGETSVRAAPRLFGSKLD